jgi:hypothetical protein
MVAPLTVSTCVDGHVVGSLRYLMPTARPSAQMIFFIYANLFIICKYLNLFIYVLLLSIYTKCRDSYFSEKLHKCYRMRVHIISEDGNPPITCLCPHVVYKKCCWIEI